MSELKHADKQLRISRLYGPGVRVKCLPYCSATFEIHVFEQIIVNLSQSQSLVTNLLVVAKTCLAPKLLAPTLEQSFFFVVAVFKNSP